MYIPRPPVNATDRHHHDRALTCPRLSSNLGIYVNPLKIHFCRVDGHVLKSPRSTRSLAQVGAQASCTLRAPVDGKSRSQAVTYLDPDGRGGGVHLPGSAKAVLHDVEHLSCKP